MKKVLIIDKWIDYGLLTNYVSVLWNYNDDKDRGRAHDAIFEALGIDRWDEDEEKYVDEIDNMVCDAFCCCGLSVNRNNWCIGKCGTQLTVQMSLFNLDEILKKKNLLK